MVCDISEGGRLMAGEKYIYIRGRERDEAVRYIRWKGEGGWRQMKQYDISNGGRGIK